MFQCWRVAIYSWKWYVLNLFFDELEKKENQTIAAIKWKKPNIHGVQEILFQLFFLLSISILFLEGEVYQGLGERWGKIRFKNEEITKTFLISKKKKFNFFDFFLQGVAKF